MTVSPYTLSRRTFLQSLAVVGLAAGGLARPVLAAGTIKPGSKAALIVVGRPELLR